MSRNAVKDSQGSAGRGIAPVVFLLAAAFCATPWCSSAIALSLGIVLALTGLTAFDSESKRLSRIIIQVCVVLLGLRVDLATLAREAGSGFAFAAATILGAFALGFVLERLLRTGRELTLLVSSGTAICGGSAIAAVGATIGSASGTMAVATGAVFILNAVALYVFPPIGHALGLSDQQFGTWAGVAIHDVSSVVGAASRYGESALDTANVVKLTRVLWILPCALFAGWMMKRDRASRGADGAAAGRPKVVFPWFILLFLVASAVRTWAPGVDRIADEIKFGAQLGFQVGLFLIGCGLSRKTLAAVGWRVLVQAILQWIVIAAAALAVVKWMR